MRTTTQIWTQEGVTQESIQAEIADKLSGADFLHLGQNIEGTVGGGNFTLDAANADLNALQSLQDIAAVTEADTATYEWLETGARGDNTDNTIWRTLLLTVKDGTDQRAVEQFEHDLLQMPTHIQTINKWGLARVISDSRWTHVWQQEYADITGLVGEYLSHPYHWAWVDTYFDMENPRHIVEPSIAHCFCPLSGTIIKS